MLGWGFLLKIKTLDNNIRRSNIEVGNSTYVAQLYSVSNRLLSHWKFEYRLRTQDSVRENAMLLVWEKSKMKIITRFNNAIEDFLSILSQAD